MVVYLSIMRVFVVVLLLSFVGTCHGSRVKTAGRGGGNGGSSGANGKSGATAPKDSITSVYQSAAEHVRVASIEGVSQAKQAEQDILAELKHIHAVSDKVKEAVAASGTKSEEAIGHLEEVIKSEQKSVVAVLGRVGEAVRSAGKVQALQWALDHTDMFEFDCLYDDHHGDLVLKSRYVVKAVLSIWMKGFGMVLDHHQADRNDKDGSKFRNQLSEQLKQLTGQNVRYVSKTDGTWAIHAN